MKNKITNRIMTLCILLSVIALSSCSTDIEYKNSFKKGESFRDTKETSASVEETSRTKKLPFNTTVPVSEEDERTEASEATEKTLSLTATTTAATVPTTTAETTTAATATTTAPETEEAEETKEAVTTSS